MAAIYNRDSKNKINTTLARHKIGKRKQFTRYINITPINKILSKNNIKSLREDFEKIMNEAEHQQEKKKEPATTSQTVDMGITQNHVIESNPLCSPN